MLSTVLVNTNNIYQLFSEVEVAISGRYPPLAANTKVNTCSCFSIKLSHAFNAIHCFSMY